MYSLPLVEELTRLSGKRAPIDAAEALRIVELAEEVFAGIPEKIVKQFRPCFPLDLLAALMVERANALRILGRRKAARLAFRGVFALANAGSQDTLLIARIAYLAGSHYMGRGKYRAASKALSLAAGIYGELEEEHRLGETQLKQAALLYDLDFLEEAIKAQTEALANLDELAEPVTALAAYSNLAEMMQRAGDTTSALQALTDSQHLAEDLKGTRAQGVWFWVRGRCRIASGTTLDGSGDLLDAWRILEPLQDTYSLGLVGVDLCRYYLERCKLEQLEHWIGPTVRALELHAPSPLVVRELAKLEESVKRMTLDAAQVGHVLELVVKTMGQRNRRGKPGRDAENAPPE
ncbi:MAG: hypothetical protein KDD47_06325 [Acidobacteria bacterium]|nr:hypothetical protein [Acidobacteriota bacterium]